MEIAAEDITGEVPLPPPEPLPKRQGASGSGDPKPASSAPTLFEELYQKNSPYLWRALRRLGVAERDADDVLQEVFLIVHRKLPTFEGRSSLRSFVYGIALRVASDYRKKAYRRRERVSEHLPEARVPPNQLRDAEQRRARRLLDSLLSTLDDKKLAVFVLYEIEQLPMEEVADAVGCTAPTGYARLSSARKQLKRSLLRRQARGDIGESFEDRGRRRGGAR